MASTTFKMPLQEPLDSDRLLRLSADLHQLTDHLRDLRRLGIASGGSACISAGRWSEWLSEVQMCSRLQSDAPLDSPCWWDVPATCAPTLPEELSSWDPGHSPQKPISTNPCRSTEAPTVDTATPSDLTGPNRKYGSKEVDGERCTHRRSW
uniref:Uncharacterized protein n=1 Tax=Eutreptiella gymnastica TaxID=73025 RepID=A0A7S1J634_9EUGL